LSATVGLMTVGGGGWGSRGRSNLISPHRHRDPPAVNFHLEMDGPNRGGAASGESAVAYGLARRSLHRGQASCGQRLLYPFRVDGAFPEILGVEHPPVERQRRG